MNNDPLITIRECAEMMTISVPTAWRRVADGTLPKPIKIGHLSRWTQSDVLETIERLKTNRHGVVA
jgi:predicted DNA-binding transcriptional regulator AlpA